MTTLNNGNPFALPTDPRPDPVNAIGTATQITEVVRLYKYDKVKITCYYKFRIILVSIITNKCPYKYTATLKHRITNILQCELLTLLSPL